MYQIRGSVQLVVLFTVFKYILNSILVIFLYKVMNLSEIEIGFVIGSAAVGFLIGNTILMKKVNKLIMQKCLFIALLYQLPVWLLYR